MTAPVLHFEGLTGGYGDTTVVRGLSATVPAGHVLGVLGRNGVGKSTLLKLLSGFLSLSAGEVRFAGQALGDMAPAERHRLGMGYCPQERIVFDDLTVRENLALAGIAGMEARLVPCFERFPRLRERLRQRAGTLSGGEKKILSLVRGLAEDTPLVLIDEPTEGVQQENIAHMADMIREQVAAGRAFVIVEQNIGFIGDLAHELLIMDHGECVLQSAAAEVDRARILDHMRV